MLDWRGYQHVGIIAADQLPSGAWAIADDILRDPELSDAVSVVGLVLALLKHSTATTHTVNDAAAAVAFTVY